MPAAIRVATTVCRQGGEPGEPRGYHGNAGRASALNNQGDINMKLPRLVKKEISINPDAVAEVNQKIKNLKDTLEKHGVFIVFNTQIGKGFLFPNTYKVCSVNDPASYNVSDNDSPMSIEGVETQIGTCFKMYDDEFQEIIPA